METFERERDPMHLYQTSPEGPRATFQRLVRILPVAIALLLVLGLPPATAAQRPAWPAVFTAEHVVLHIEPDSLRVEGEYLLVCRHDTPSTRMALNFPYPDDPLLGGARTVQLAYRLGAEPWQDLSWRELPDSRGALWSLPISAGDSLWVRTTYRQALQTTYARYIVTTTAAWGAPLQSARFEIHLPEGAVAEEFSFPFAPCEPDGRSAWCYEAAEFLPDRDVTVRWRLVGESMLER